MRSTCSCERKLKRTDVANQGGTWVSNTPGQTSGIDEYCGQYTEIHNYPDPLCLATNALEWAAYYAAKIYWNWRVSQEHRHGPAGPEPTEPDSCPGTHSTQVTDTIKRSWTISNLSSPPSASKYVPYDTSDSEETDSNKCVPECGCSPNPPIVCMGPINAVKTSENTQTPTVNVSYSQTGSKSWNQNPFPDTWKGAKPPATPQSATISSTGSIMYAQTTTVYQGSVTDSDSCYCE